MNVVRDRGGRVVAVSGVLSGQLRQAADAHITPGLTSLLRDAAERIDEQEAEIYELRDQLHEGYGL